MLSLFLRKRMPALLACICTTSALTPGLANPKIRTAFFDAYPSAVGSALDNLPSQAGHCGVCHYNFKNGGDPWNPYGQSLRDIGGLGGKNGADSAIRTVRTLDQDNDGYTALTEVTDLSYTNTPTFPGLAAANINLIIGVPSAEVQPYLKPVITIDNTPPAVTVLSPNGGESLTGNGIATITWSASDASGIATVHLYLSLDDGASYAPIAFGVAPTGSYDFIPANRPTSTARIRVVAIDGAANSGFDQSDASFSIVSPPGGTVPTTLRDFDMPGTQPFEGGPALSDPSECAVCHGNYDPAAEPYRNWSGSMMAQASRDPLFQANLAIANQDAPDSGDLCLRCHLPRGWLQGRSVPTDGSLMLPEDQTGVSCDLCHRMVDPVYVADFNPSIDAGILADLSFPGTEYGNGMYVIDPSGIQRGPFDDAAPPHAFNVSSFHRRAAFCGTCHDVSNPAFTRDENGTYQPNALDATSDSFSPHAIAPVERTYSEWLNSSYNSPVGVYAPEFAGNKFGAMVSTCQDCHMRDIVGYGANHTLGTLTVPLRQDLPLHDMTGGSTWMPGIIAMLYPDAVDAAALQAGADRATYMLQHAADLNLDVDSGELVVTVINQTGHKLPTGYPEGRRIWINVRFYDADSNLLGESGAYDPATGILTRDAEVKVYEVHPGIDDNIAAAVGLPAEPSLHFVLNNRIYEDNRIPPRGFSNTAYASFGGAPVGHSYADGQYWDDTRYRPPFGAVRAEVALYYQSTSKEFVEFLRDENTTNSKGQELYDLWANHGRCPPTLMQAATWTWSTPILNPDLDEDGDGLSNGFEEAEGLDPFSALDALHDNDRDGLSNLEEFAFHSGPFSSSSCNRPHQIELPIGDARYVAIRYQRRKDLATAAIVAEVSFDMKTWNSGNLHTTEESIDDLDTESEEVTERSNTPLAPGQPQFIRLRVESAP